MSTEQLSTPDLSHQVSAHGEALAAGGSAERSTELTPRLAKALGRALRETTFANRMLIAPRRLDGIGQEAAAAFLGFLEAGDEEAVHERGRQLALEGLGHRSILSLTEALRRASGESLNPGAEALPAFQEALGRYVSALLEGYMAGREEDILKEQERTREAYLRARARLP